MPSWRWQAIVRAEDDAWRASDMRRCARAAQSADVARVGRWMRRRMRRWMRWRLGWRMGGGCGAVDAMADTAVDEVDVAVA
eukprot:4496568-Prymnesium_polylepis.1